MKQLVCYFLCFLLWGGFSEVSAQVPQSIMIQGLAQDAEGNPLTNQEVSVSVSLNGVTLDHDPLALTSNAGVFRIEVSAIDLVDLLRAGEAFLDVEVEGIPLSTPLLSVPYALIAEEVVNDAVEDDDADPTNEFQTLEFSDGLLKISDGNEISIPTGSTDADADPTNELQTLEFSDGVLKISDGNEVIIPTSGEDADADPTNELQTLEFSDGLLKISDGNEVNITTGGEDADADPTNELQTLSYEDGILSISDGNDIAIPTGGTDADADPFNELQNLSKEGNLIILDQDGGSVVDEIDDADADPTNELQELLINGNSLSIVPPGQGDLSVSLPMGGGNSPWEVNGDDISYSDGQVIVKHGGSTSVIMDADNRNGAIEVFDEDNEKKVELIANGSRDDPQGPFGYLELYGPNGNSNVILGFVGTQTEQDRGGLGLYNEGDQAWWFGIGSQSDPDLSLYYLNGNSFTRVGEFSRTNGQYSSLSDLKAKRNIATLPSILTRVMALRPVTYRFRHDLLQQNEMGFIAQEVQELFPELVHDMDGRLTLNYSGFSVLAIKSIQELTEQREILQGQIDLQAQTLKEQADLLKDLQQRLMVLEQKREP